MARPKSHKIYLIVLLLLVVWVIWAVVRPLPALKPSYTRISPVIAKSVALPWPGSGQAAIGATDYGVLQTGGTQAPAPMASVAKIVTAMAVLKQKPLALNQPGPTITFDDTDVSYYQSYVSQGGSVAKVVAGEQISEYQALQTMLLPSANNLAESLARWAFGSPDAYLTYANQFVKTLGLTQTTMADASGFAPQTVSSAQDLVNLGLAAENNPVLAQIANLSQADVPVVGIVKNTNFLLGSDGFVGIKTGNTDQAGGVYLFASNQTVGSQTIKVVGAVMNAPSLITAINQGKALTDAAKTAFVQTSAVRIGQELGRYTVPWSRQPIQAIAEKDISLLAWQNTKIIPAVTLKDLHSGDRGLTIVGEVSVTANNKTAKVSAITNRDVPKPSLFWRLLHL